MPVDLAISIALDVFKTWIVALIRWQLTYVIFYKRTMKDLEEQVGKLENVMKRVHNDVQEARNNGENINHNVTEW